MDVTEYLGLLAVAAYVTDADGHLSFYNEAAAKFWGMRPPLGSSSWLDELQIIAPDATQDDAAPDQPVAARPREATLVRRDGTKALFVPYSTPLVGSNGETAGEVTLLFQLTDRDAGNVDNSRLAAIVDGSDDAIIGKTLDGRITSWNAGASRIFGYDAAEMIGEAIARIVPLELQHEEEEILERLRHGERVDHFETTRVAKDGSRIEVSVTVSPVRDRLGNVVGASKTARDITDRNIREKELRDSVERFRLLTRATTDAIWDWDFDHNQVWWSDGLRILFGHEPHAVELEPEFWSSRVHSEDHERVVASITRSIEGSDDTWRDAYRFIRADGSIAHVTDHGFIIRDRAGKALRMIGGMADVSAQLETEERLRQAQKMEAIGNLTGGLAHDFNNLLSVIIGNLDMLREQLANEPQSDEFAEEALNAALRGAELTSRLLAFARRQPLQPRQIQLDGLIVGISKLLSRTVGENIEIRHHLDPKVWPVIVDPVQLEACLMNIITNARDAMPAGGQLIISTGNRTLDRDYADLHPGVLAGDYALIELTDTGTGMDEATLARIFEPFFTTKGEGRGTGLGLAMVFGFVKQSGGHISVYSEVGAGSTFRLYLPRSVEAVVTVVAAPVSPQRAAGSGETVLVVEDNERLRELVILQLTQLGYRPSWAADGPSAIKLLEAQTVDLVFTDVVMPGGMSGVELAAIVASRWPDKKILLTSGFPQERIAGNGAPEASSGPAARLLSKPYRKEDLARVLREVLDT